MKFEFSENGLECKWNDVIINVNKKDQLYILYEILVKEIYNIGHSKKDFSIIDIGMNIGCFTLIMASKYPSSNLYCYEPFPYSYNLALKKYSELILKLRDRIVTYNCGLEKSR